MKREAGVLMAVVFAFGAALQWAGYDSAYQVGYGAISMMGVVISATFFWLWWVRATPLALGMAFSWAGAGSVMGWWWIFNMLEQPQSLVQHNALFLFLSLYIVGAISHFRVIQQALELPRHAFWLPVGGTVLLSMLIWRASH